MAESVILNDFLEVLRRHFLNDSIIFPLNCVEFIRTV